MLRGICWLTILALSTSDNNCFCKLQGKVEDCCCTISDADNTHKLTFHKLSSLLKRDYFRFYKVNLYQKCQFWSEIGVCNKKTCALKSCDEGEVPEGLSNNQELDKKNKSGIGCEEEREFSKITNIISEESKEALKDWDRHDNKIVDFCAYQDESSENAQFFDLLQNPERFTGYTGEASHRVWRSIYQENCFKPMKDNIFQTLSSKSINYMCREKRVFYRAISGLHSSISLHLAAKYPNKDTFGEKWGYNIEEFSRRFTPRDTKGEGPHWLKNLYFVYLLEMRALTKALPLWKSMTFYSGDEAEDQQTKTLVLDVVESLKSCPDTFDEAQLFRGKASEGLFEDFRSHFQNISLIMDCVTCDKCRLWGKIQTRGLGTALKILFSDVIHGESLKLTRGEVVTLFNGFNQLSHSIEYVRLFKEKLEFYSPNSKPGMGNLFTKKLDL